MHSHHLHQPQHYFHSSLDFDSNFWTERWLETTCVVFTVIIVGVMLLFWTGGVWDVRKLVKSGTVALEKPTSEYSLLNPAYSFIDKGELISNLKSHFLCF